MRLNHCAPKSAIGNHFAPPRNDFLVASLDQNIFGLNVTLDERGVMAAFVEALHAAARRAKELGDEFGAA